MTKKTVCVVFGGQSSEHEISCLSGQNVVRHLNKERYHVLKLGITPDGEWLLHEGSEDAMVDGSWRSSGKRAFFSPDRSQKGLLVIDKEEMTVLPVDVVYLALHGKNGEDGTIQGLLELAGIPYTGAGVLSSALCMDKATAKLVFAAGGIPQAKWVEVRRWELQDADAVQQKVSNVLTYPVFVKPSAAGSSFGTAKVHDETQLLACLQHAFEYDSRVMVEEYIDAIEVETAVTGLRGRQPEVAVPGMIQTDAEFYDYDAKYTDGASTMVVPAPISEGLQQTLQQYAKQAYLLAECNGFARVDFFVERGTERVLLNEINTIPGHTKYSMFHVMWAASGVPFSQLLDRIVDYALHVDEAENATKK